MPSQTLKSVLAATGALALAATTAAPAFAQQQQPGQLTVLRTIDADNYDPIRSTATAAAEIVYLLADTLVSVDFDMQTVQPLLAESWEVSDDGLTYTFKLRQDVKFCSGRAMTAEDVVFSFERWLSPESSSPTKFRAGNVAEIRAINDHTVEYRLNEPYSDLLFQLALSFASVVDRESVEELGENFGVQGFGGTGPYCWNSWTPRQEVVLDKNPHYTWGPPIYENGTPQVERMVWRVIPEANTMMAAVQTGQADMTYYMAPFAIESLRAIPTLTVQQQDNYLYDNFVGFKTDKPVMNDPAMRRAINQAVNRDALAQAAFFGLGTALHSLLNPKVIDYDPATAELTPAYDPDAAIATLEEAGWELGSDGVRVKDGQRAEFLLYGIRNTQNPVMMEGMQADLRRIGVEMEIQLWDGTAAWGRLATQEFDAFVLSYPYVTATEALSLYFRSTQMPTPNRMNWNNEETDRLIDEARQATDDETRKAAIGAAQRQLVEADVWMPIVSQPMILVSGQRVEGARPHGIYGAGIYKGLDISLTD
ncbi:ABC transporter substrate-binding protein [Aurantimonas aggregata]|uniref:ABC transporter substrate-binding protein n=1 Tax=Aurantimonas aggregata TaxID=2047720 RepID=A0A6L9MP20_9HYPH|nr:ABC transporter substrate-binding protein [Aurantimonas aggregata]NDV89158.1 ABC transporter substrate-binding protein [Aurantimonas aggregata]